jgi:hypothetical protein
VGNGGNERFGRSWKRRPSFADQPRHVARLKSIGAIKARETENDAHPAGFAETHGGVFGIENGPIVAHRTNHPFFIDPFLAPIRVNGRE